MGWVGEWIFCSRDVSLHTGVGGFFSFFLVKNRFIEYRYWLSNVLCSMPRDAVS